MADNERLIKIESLVEKIFKILNGNDKEGGLVTEVALLQQRISNMPTPNSLKFHASVGGGVVMVFALLVFGVVKAFSG